MGWKGGYDASHDSEEPHRSLSATAGGRLAIAAWQARQAAIPVPAPSDRAARHRYRGPLAAAPSVAPAHAVPRLRPASRVRFQLPLVAPAPPVAAAVAPAPLLQAVPGLPVRRSARRAAP